MLYIIATPIGNLEDTTFRALKILKEADFVLCEDTRVTSKLLAHFNIKSSTISYHQHSKLQKLEKIKELLEEGKVLAMVSDAGTPGISDPGGQLVSYVARELPNIKIIPIPGASALPTALSVSGFSADRFVFLGFPPHKKGREKFFKELAEYKYTVALFESKYRILKTLEEIKKHSGDREAMVAREITKMFETIYRGKISDIIKEVGKSTPRGEYVIVLK
ncbi:16S rRNA (cytidine(1402)-2'-O)-methyltransferase [Candidatus Parcubacteria bacterium]|nr:16S rRNA (cytidine(1402)-2'-O)-methyltransferase [Patescibacteria group bacterium]MCG2693682.1 16S rRNA (cytidine(1402)-2'-O)-methyltransferase [Candidatus Parcubacteria bacterium]